MSAAYTEDHLVEQPAIALLRDELRWDYLNAYAEWASGSSALGREAKRDVVLVERLRPALEKLNPQLPAEALDAAVEELTRDRSALSLVEANREIYRLLRNGIKVKVENPANRGQETKVVKVIDWEDATENDFLLTSQLWVSGELYTRRPDVVGFVNGLPLVLIEFKKPGVHVREGFDQNITDYKAAIPQLFHFNALILISNGTQSKLGSVSAKWGHFCDWRKVASEEEDSELSLETILRGCCEKTRLLDLTENFTRFSEGTGGLTKVVARNHQYLGVNQAVEALQESENGRIGVFWHTQGSGKSYSMVFFAEKVFRKIPGNWTFVVITDRKELDSQIYRTFATCDAATEGHCQAESAEHLRELLTGDHRYVFTLIHKFRTEPGTLHEVLSERDDIIVLTDEAHRSQYDTLAMNMRTALPNAKFVAFTGTPLIAGEERTREVFGDYVSIYNFRQSIEDGATVPLFYENRTPELDITNPHLNEEIYEIIDEADLDADGEAKIERLLGQRYHLITRDDRLDVVAKDIVHHFINRGHQGKAMVVSIDKATALKMYNKVDAEWQAERSRLQAVIERFDPNSAEYQEADRKLRILIDTDRAVIVSPGQNEIAEMAKRGLDILPHRERMVREDLETAFKDPDAPLGLVFVCAMWLTGFDAPSCSTIYLDKPMRGHTLMQTIARANRVYGEKVSGLIVDYANVFLELEKALAIYAGGKGGEVPVKDKSELIEALRIALSQLDAFCRKQDVILADVQAAPVQHFHIAVNRLAKTDLIKDNYLSQANDIGRLYKAIMPDPVIPSLAPLCQVVQELAKALRALKEPVDVSAVLDIIEAKLDDSILAEAGIKHGEVGVSIDLSKVDFDALEKKFSKSPTKNSEAVKLRALIERKLRNLIRFNASRYDYLDRFEKMVEEYNKGSVAIEEFFQNLVAFSKELNAEEARHMREQLSEEELAAFDILTRPGPDLTQKETDEIKKVCRDMLAKLKTEMLVLNWRKKRTSRAAVRVEIEKMLDSGLPEAYTVELFEQKSGALFQHILEKYPEQGSSVYQDGVA
jgi:type I restriction enzyme R subunit